MRLWRAAAATAAVAACTLPGGVAHAQAFTGPGIVWANNAASSIAATSLAGSPVNESLVTGQVAVNGVAMTSQNIYWTIDQGNGSIGVANLDGTDPRPSFITGASDPTGLTTDGRHLYWTNATGTIAEANLDGSDVNQSLITGADVPEGVVVAGQKIYWTNFRTGTIGEANLDGSDVNQSFITGATEPQGIATDGQRLYWTNFGTATIGESNLDGTNVNQSLISGANGPEGIAANSQHIYWTNFETGTIGDANLDGTNVNQSFITGASGPVGIAVAPPAQATVTPTAAAFPSTPTGATTAPTTVTVTNTGAAALSLSGLTFAGADPGDYVLSSDGCLATIAPGASCQLTVKFNPQTQGASQATLQIASNDPNSPANVNLSATGGALPQALTGPQRLTGPQGPAGTNGLTGLQGPAGTNGLTGLQGPAGPKGPRGAQGPAGPAGTIICRATAHARLRCALEFAPGTATVLNTTRAVQYRIQRRGHTIAHGTITIRDRQITARSLGTLCPGRYTLTLASGRGHHQRLLLKRVITIPWQRRDRRATDQTPAARLAETRAHEEAWRIHRVHMRTGCDGPAAEIRSTTRGSGPRGLDVGDSFVRLRARAILGRSSRSCSPRTSPRRTSRQWKPA